MSAAQGLYFATELEIPANSVVVEDTKAVDDSQWLSGRFDYFIGDKLQIRRVGDGKYECLSVFEGSGQVVLDPDIDELVLIAEEPGEGVAGGRVRILFFELKPMLEIRVVYFEVGTHFSEFPDNNLGAAVAGVGDILSIAGTT